MLPTSEHVALATFDLDKVGKQYRETDIFLTPKKRRTVLKLPILPVILPTCHNHIYYNRIGRFDSSCRFIAILEAEAINVRAR